MFRIKSFLLIASFSFIHLSFSFAQTTIFYESLATQESFNKFTVENLIGAQTWYCSSYYGYTLCSGYEDGESFDNEDWLISPEIDLTEVTNVQLSFDHTRGNAAVVNVGVNEGWYKVFATASYTGNVETTQWVEMEGINHTLMGAWQWNSTGMVAVPTEAQSATTRIALRYISIAPESATWEVKNILITGTLPDNEDIGMLKITGWNTEWLGCPRYGPSNEQLQVENVATAMLSMNSDIYCLQEVTHSSNYPSIYSIVSLLGDEWGGAIVANSIYDCSQNQGIIYRKSKVQLINSQLLENGSSAEGNSYYYNWTSGRYPALYNVNIKLSNNEQFPITLINIHAKAEDGAAMSYIRRKGASISLKEILDDERYNSKNVIIIGDFNDYLIGTTSGEHEGSESPYQNFMDDRENYLGITKDLVDAGPFYTSLPLIDHIVISNELFDEYVDESATQEVAVTHIIDNFYYTTSDHLPVSARFHISSTGNGSYVNNYENKEELRIFPNPVKDVLYILNESIEMDEVFVFDITGRTVSYSLDISQHSVNVSHLKPGIYFIQVGENISKFIKD